MCVCVCVCVLERESVKPCSMVSDSVVSFSGVGHLLFCHNFSILSKYSISFSNSCTKKYATYKRGQHGEYRHLLEEFLSIVVVIFCPLSCGDFLSSTSLTVSIINVVRNTVPLSIFCIKRGPNNLTTYTKYRISVWYRSSHALAKAHARSFLFSRISLLLRVV